MKRKEKGFGFFEAEPAAVCLGSEELCTCVQASCELGPCAGGLRSDANTFFGIFSE